MIRRVALRALTLFLLALTVLSGVVGLLVPMEPNNVAAPFPELAQTLWFLGLLLGGMVGIAGVVSSGVIGLYIERAGLWILTGICFCVLFGAISYLYSPYDWVGVISVGIFGLCCGARAWAIGDEAKERAMVQLAREMQ